MRTKATDNDGGDLLCEGRKWGKIRPVGTISREGMRAYFWRQNVTKSTLPTTLRSARKENKDCGK
jgi:hypothetical protein